MDQKLGPELKPVPPFTFEESDDTDVYVLPVYHVVDANDNFVCECDSIDSAKFVCEGLNRIHTSTTT